MYYLISDLVLTAILIIFIAFIIFVYLSPSPEYDKKNSRTFRGKALTVLVCLGMIIYLSFSAYSLVFPDRWNCPDCEQVNIYYDHMFQYPVRPNGAAGVMVNVEEGKLRLTKVQNHFTRSHSSRHQT